MTHDRKSIWYRMTLGLDRAEKWGSVKDLCASAGLMGGAYVRVPS